MNSRLIFALCLQSWIIGLSVGVFHSLGVATTRPRTSLQADEASSPILEIIDQYVGMWPFAGRYIHFRLFEDGRSEYEKLAKSDAEPKWKAVKYEAKLSAKDVLDFVELAESREFLQARASYPERWSGIDATHMITISYNRAAQKRVIKLVNYGPRTTPRGSDYPEILEKLMKKVEIVRGNN